MANEPKDWRVVFHKAVGHEMTVVADWVEDKDGVIRFTTQGKLVAAIPTEAVGAVWSELDRSGQ